MALPDIKELNPQNFRKFRGQGARRAKVQFDPETEMVYVVIDGIFFTSSRFHSFPRGSAVLISLAAGDSTVSILRA
ncbi:MAG: hypothetical protein ABH835_02970 [Patescibacteria group bacterium]